MTEDKSLTLGILLSHLILPAGRAKNQNGERKVKTQMRTDALKVAKKESTTYSNISLLDLQLTAYKGHAAMIISTKKLVEAVKEEYAKDQENSAKVKTLDQLLDAAKHFYEIPLTAASEMLTILIDKHPGTFSIDGYEASYVHEEGALHQPELPKQDTCVDKLVKTDIGRATVTMLHNGAAVLEILGENCNWADAKIAVSKRLGIAVRDIRFGVAPVVPAIPAPEPEPPLKQVVQPPVVCNIIQELEEREAKLQAKSTALQKSKDYGLQTCVVEQLTELDGDIRIINDIREKWLSEDKGAETDKG